LPELTVLSPTLNSTLMIFAIRHTITNPEVFWKRAQESLPNLPQGFKVHSVMPDASMKNAVCIWEAESLDKMRAYLEGAVGDVSTNDYIVVNEAAAMGIPKS